MSLESESQPSEYVKDLNNSQASDIDIMTEQDIDEAEEPGSDADDITPEELKELERQAILEEEEEKIKWKRKLNKKKEALKTDDD